MVCYVCFEKKKKKERKKGKKPSSTRLNTLTHIISCVSDWSGYRGLTIDITCVLYVPDLQQWFSFIIGSNYVFLSMKLVVARYHSP